MDSFLSFMASLIQFMKTPVNLWGHQVTFWGIFLFVMLADIIAYFIGEMWR